MSNRIFQINGGFIRIYEKKNRKNEKHNSNEKSYKAPKLAIDCGHDTSVGPMQMFMYEAWKNKPEYGINTQYCGFSCNHYFELYRNKKTGNYSIATI